MAANSTKVDRTALDDLLDRQRRAPLPALYGQKPGISPPGKELVKTGVSEVIDQGSAVVVLFSAVNVQDHAVELMPPQIQLGGMKKSGKIVRKSRWSTAEQLPVTDFRMSRRRLGPVSGPMAWWSSSVHLSSSRPRRCSFRWLSRVRWIARLWLRLVLELAVFER